MYRKKRVLKIKWKRRGEFYPFDFDNRENTMKQNDEEMEEEIGIIDQVNEDISEAEASLFKE